MNKPKRLLIGGLSDKAHQGGMENYVMDLYRHCDHQKLQFDFINSNQNAMAYRDEILSMGGRIFNIPLLRDGMAAHYKGLHYVYSSTHYLGAYFQSALKMKNLDFFKFAKRYRVPLRMLHSHNSTEDSPSLFDQLREKNVDRIIDRYVNMYLACSKEAGKWMFGERPFTVIPNSIDTDKFSYQPYLRKKIREKYHLQGKLVLGTVGRLTEAKNPFYIMQIFSELKKQNPNVAFLHVGDGPLMERLKKKAVELNIKDDYFFIGQSDQVVDFLNAMDVFLLPSRYEGFPIVLVEAQSTGLPCFVADNIPVECRLTDDMYFIGIDNPPSTWAAQINQIFPCPRKDQSATVADAGYDIHRTAQRFQNYILKSACKYRRAHIL